MPHDGDMTLRVIALYVKPVKGAIGVPVASLDITPGYGIAGDHHTGQTRVRSTGEVVENVRHFTAVSAAELGAVAEEMGVPYIDPAWIGANICFAFDGSDRFTRSLPDGTRLCDAADRAVLEVRGDTAPCLVAGGVIASRFPHLGVRPERFPRCAMHRRGIYGVALEPATIRTGDVFTALVPVRR